MQTKLIQTKDYLLLINEESERGKYVWDKEQKCIRENNRYNVTDFDVEIVAYYPLTSEAKELDLPELPNPFDEVDIEKIALEWFVKANKQDIIFDLGWMKIFEAGYKAAFKQFSLEDIKKACKFNPYYMEYGNVVASKSDKEIDEFIQSLSTQQLPKDFISEYEIGVYPKTGKQAKRFKTITNSESKQELVGKYVY